MQALKIILLVAAIIYFLVYIIFAICGKKPIRTILLFSFFGIISLTAVNLTSSLTGVYIPLNPWSLSVSAAGGIPATVALLLMRTVLAL
ncbi:MAG: transcriptional regulator [Ruminococcaceae bacterium]|nr:transcriptional regulator [Oscillospiraceae bacterium]